MKNLVLVTTWGNILCKIDNYVSDKCIYLTVLTGRMKGGLINVSKDELKEIPDTEGKILI